MNKLFLSLLLFSSPMFGAASSSASSSDLTPAQEAGPFEIGEYDDTKYVVVTNFSNDSAFTSPLWSAIIMKLAEGADPKLLQKFGTNILMSWPLKLNNSSSYASYRDAMTQEYRRIAGECTLAQKAALLCKKSAMLFSAKDRDQPVGVSKATGEWQEGQDISISHLSALKDLYSGSISGQPPSYVLKFADATDGDGSPVVTYQVSKEKQRASLVRSVLMSSAALVDRTMVEAQQRGPFAVSGYDSSKFAVSTNWWPTSSTGYYGKFRAGSIAIIGQLAEGASAEDLENFLKSNSTALKSYWDQNGVYLDGNSYQFPFLIWLVATGEQIVAREYSVEHPVSPRVAKIAVFAWKDVKVDDGGGVVAGSGVLQKGQCGATPYLEQGGVLEDISSYILKLPGSQDDDGSPVITWQKPTT